MTEERFKQSALALDRAAAIPGRSSTRSKSPGRFYPVGRGSLYATDWADGNGTVVTVDGTRLVDMVCALGAISVGKLDECGPFRAYGVASLPARMEGDTANIVLSRVTPWATRVRFVKTGSEATHAAYRIAKAATGRKHVLVGDWAYHGWHEWCDDKSFPWTHRYANGEQLDKYADSVGDRDLSPEDIAAVFVEPHRWEATDIGWLKSVREFCEQYGILLVFDEMIYGGRWALGGATEFFGVVPDLACYGKALGNGQAVAFVAGREELAEHGEVVSGTYSGDMTGLESLARTVIAYASRPVIETLWRRGRQLRRGLEAVVRETGWQEAAAVEGAGDVHLRLRFNRPDLGLEFAARMSDRGVLWHPQVVNVCYAHTEAQIEHVVQAASEALESMKEFRQ